MKLTKGKSHSLKDYANREVNLLPNEFHKTAKIRLAVIASVIVAILCVSIFGYYEYNVLKETETLKEEMMMTRTRINANKQEIENQNIVISLGNRIQLKEVLLNFIFSTNRSIVDILSTFESTLNGQVYLNSLSANSNEMFTINASAKSPDAISYLINQLKRLRTLDNDKYFSNVFTNGITRTEDDEGDVLYLFQLSCKFEGGVVNEVE